jgi:hypothetical protein
MKTTDLYDSRNPLVNTAGLNAGAWTCDLRVDAGFAPEDPDHSRGFVRLEMDREPNGCCGGIAMQVKRAGAVHNGELKDVLEIHTRGNSETAALGRALIFAGRQILSRADSERIDVSTRAGILYDSPSGSVWRDA